MSTEPEAAPAGVAHDAYTPEERAAMLRQMQAASDGFYLHARTIGYHQFVEIAGFMNEVIKAAEEMEKRGIDFTAHDLRLATHHAEYVGEKLGCIFGGALGVRENWKAFLKGLVG